MAASATLMERDAKPNLLPPSSTTNKRKRDSLDHDSDLRNPNFRRPGSPSRAADMSDQTLLGSHATGGDEDSMNQEFANALVHHNAESPLPAAQQQNPNHDPSLQQNGSIEPSHGGPSASDTAAAALSHYSMTVPPSTEQSFLSQTSGPESGSGSFGLGGPEHHGQHSLSDYSLDALKTGSGTGQNQGDGNAAAAAGKPTVGSDEWHKVRRDNHKEVERRRRETINEGINELAKIVPGCEKNKGSILQRAVSFITQLKENESQNIEKWTLEKLLTEQAIAELSSSCDKLKAECQRAWDECELWKRAAKDAGVIPEELRGREEGGQSGD